ncbi:MAG: tRNA (guanine(46)-N(7))-methyltransferase TrmB [Pseudomonadota bacterium]
MLPKSRPPEFNASRIDWDLKHNSDHQLYEDFFQDRRAPEIPKSFLKPQSLWLEIGAGTGHFFESLARLHPEKSLVAIERDRMRGKRLVRRSQECGLTNFLGIRGNAISAFMTGIASETLERVYILYPCPWPKNAHRKHRWHFHPTMLKLVAALEKNGHLILASDQKFYVDEAHYVCTQKYGLEVLRHGEISPHPLNALELFPKGRTKFEQSFLAQGQPCYELIVKKS